MNRITFGSDVRAGSPARSLGAVAVVGLAAGLLYVLTGCQSQEPPGPRKVSIDRYVQGVLAYQSGDRERAIAALQKALEANRDLTMAHDLLGDLYQDKQEWSNAAEQYKALCELDPYTPSNHYKLGLMNQLLNRLEEALKSYLRAIKLNPKDFNSNMNLGMVYLALDQPDEAVKYARRATELNPKSAPAWSNLGVALDALPQGPVPSTTQQSQAEQAYRTALELDSDQNQTAMYLAENLMRQQKFREARSIMNQVVQKSNTPMAHKLFGDTMFLERRFDDALKEYSIALKLNPRFYRAMNEVGWVLMQQYHDGMELDEKKKKSALAYWQASLGINANQPKIKQLVKTYTDKQLFAPD